MNVICSSKLKLNTLLSFEYLKVYFPELINQNLEINYNN